ncbi:hypothetical protein L7F22_069187 [Adiantum nelumboides]|nr:hypothetical protein [Adiantum nelumboides]
MYMIFVKDSLSDVNKTQVNESGLKEDLELSKFLNQFQDVFIDDIPGELPPKRGDDDHAIELIPGSSPPNKPPYRVSQAQQEEIMRQVNELVEKGMVRPSSSPFCSPVLLVHKKDGTYRMCVDYRALNKITIKNRFLVPRIEDLFDKLQGSTYFNRIDLKSGYHQIRIVNEDILKTAFRTTFGLYEYLVMPFGLTNAPATFNRMMERIFQPHRNFTGVFFDDVIFYSKSMEEHKKHLQIHAFKQRENEKVKEASLRFKQYIERCPRRELPQDERSSVLFMEGLRNETLKKDLHLKAYSTFEQVTREALYLVDNCTAYGEVSEDAESIAIGTSSVKSDTSIKRDLPAAPTTEQMIEEITKRIQKQMKNPIMKHPQMRKCDICGGDHPTPWCTQ